MQEIFGYYPSSVIAEEKGKYTYLTVKYDSYTVFATYTEGNYSYFASVGTAGGEDNRTITVDNSIFKPEFDDFYALLVGGEQKQSLRDFISPVFVLDAIERSLASGNEETIAPIPQEI